MVGTSTQELIRVNAASEKWAIRSIPVACLRVANGSMMATRLSIAAAVTTARMMGADSSSSMYREQICAAVRRDIQTKIKIRNKSTPQFQPTSTRLNTDQWPGRQQYAVMPAATEIQNLG